MAIYHFHAQIIKRSEGRNAVAAAAYRRATKLFDEKEQRYFDFTNKENVVHSEILVPDNAPEWVKQLVNTHQNNPDQAAETLWNLVEKTEKRVDSQLSREIEFALPIELTQEQNIQLAREYIKDQMVSRGMIADWNIHLDEGNPHVHVMLTMRELTHDGFGEKVRAWDAKGLNNELRQKWAEYANFHLRLHQHDVRIDHRSYKDQGIDLIPTVHLGKAVCDMHKRGIKTDLMTEYNRISQENLSRIMANPNILLDKISSQTSTFDHQKIGQELGKYINAEGNFNQQELGILANIALGNLKDVQSEINENNILTQDNIANIFANVEHHESVFTEKHLAKMIQPYTQNADQFAKALIQVKSSSELILLGAGDDGRDRFTTRKMFVLENDIQKLADEMRDTAHIKITNRQIQQVLEEYQTRINKHLTDEQMQAVKHILKPSSMSCIVGRAGTGKSFSLGAAKEVWQAKGLQVYGVALSGIAADGLSKDANIPSRTIESFKYAIEQGQIQLDPHSVIVMDEAGMTDSVSMKAVIDAAYQAKAKLVLVGDHAQIQPVGPGASFRALIERLGFAEIHTVYRQKEQWQRDATVAFSGAKVADGLTAYLNKKCIHFENNNSLATTKLTQDWFATRALNTTKPLSEFLVIAHRNEDVNLLNKLIRSELVRRGEIAGGYQVRSSHSGLINIAQGDRLLFLKNDRKLGVSNGRFATIKSVNFTESGKVIDFVVILDGTNKEVRINPEQYKDFAYGYAATVHKVQGMTVDHCFVYAGGMSWNRHLTYVAMSRHRDTCNMYVDKSIYNDDKALIKGLGKLGIKDSLLDFPLAFSERRGLEVSGLLKILPKHLAKRMSGLKEKLSDQVEQIINPEKYYKNQEEKAQERINAELVANRREDARLVAKYMDVNKEVGMAWQALQSKLYDLGIEKMTYESKSFELISGTKEYDILQKASLSRNRIASEIMIEPWRYQKAIEIYGIDLKKLLKQSNNHLRFEEVKLYQEYCKNGKVIFRDKIAANIMSNIKEHYSALQQEGVDGKDIRTHAIAHLRRNLLKNLSSTERSAFKLVEEYQNISQHIGKIYSEIKENSQEATYRWKFVKNLEELSLSRDRLAFEILNERSKFDQALDFYQIGIAAPRFNQKPTDQQIKQAENRWYKLQQSAARYELKDRVKQYTQSTSKNTTVESLKLAFAIMQDVKAHHGAIKTLGLNAQDTWRAIRRDAKLYERFDRYQKLDLVEQLGFKVVESYINAKQSNAAAWREIFESKKAAALDDKTFYSSLSKYAAQYTKERDKLANEILGNISLYQAGLNYFNIKADDLNAQSYKHQCRENVLRYSEGKKFLDRAEAAAKIIADPKSHHGQLIEKDVQWRDVYRSAAATERKALFSTISLEEKKLIRAIENYKRADQAVGKFYGKIKDSNIAFLNNTAEKTRLDQLKAARDSCAYRLVNIKEKIDMRGIFEDYQISQLTIDWMSKKHLSWDKISNQAKIHNSKLLELKLWNEDYELSLKKLKYLVMTHSSKNTEALISPLLDWMVERKDQNVDSITQKLLIQKDSYRMAMLHAGVDSERINKQQILVDNLKETVDQWITLANKKEKDIAITRSPEEKQRIQKAREIAQKTKSIHGTLAEKYLREHRNISGHLEDKNLRYHPNLRNWMTGSSHPALVVLAREKNDQICGLQAIFLDSLTAKKADLGIHTKLSRGITSEGSLVQQGMKGGTVAFAEGPESALSIATARPDWTVYVTFGVRNFDKVPLKANASSVLLCIDNDGINSGTEKSVKEAARRLVSEGKDVWIVLPEKPSKMKKWDFNDSLKHYGIEKVNQELNNVFLNKKGVTQEKLSTDVIKTTLELINEKTAHLHDDKNVVKEISLIETYDINTILKHYVSMELEQSKLVSELHDARLNDQLKAKEISIKSINHYKSIQNFAAEALQHPEISTMLAKNIKPETLASRGGFKEIGNRLNNNIATDLDLAILVNQLKNKAKEYNRSLQQDRDRGGRSL